MFCVGGISIGDVCCERASSDRKQPSKTGEQLQSNPEAITTPELQGFVDEVAKWPSAFCSDNGDSSGGGGGGGDGDSGSCGDETNAHQTLALAELISWSHGRVTAGCLEWCHDQLLGK
jgi:hypothetical protein